MSDHSPDESKALTPTFPSEVHESLAALRKVAKAAKSADDPLLRKATKEEIALAQTLKKLWMCHAHSVRTGLPCEAAAWRQGLCRVHGAEAPALKKQHQRKLVEMLPKAERALNELLDQTDHLPSRLNAVKEVHDRAIGPVRGSSHENKQGVQVNIGIGWGLASSSVQVEGEVIDSNPVAVEEDESV